MPDVISAISGLVATAQLWRDQSGEDKATRRKALSDLKKALRHTEMYIRDLNKQHGTTEHLHVSEGRDWKVEMELADLWSEASFSCRDLDRNIARMADMKSGFWEDVTRWSRARITRAGIAISEARERIEELEARLNEKLE